MTVEASSVRQPAPRTMPSRGDWWIQPATVFVGLLIFAIYSAWAVLFGNAMHAYEVGPYLSPYYSPLLKFGWFPLSPAALVAPFPLLFRLTCYYYRKAYYRSFFLDPPACAIRELRNGNYTGERRFPLVLNNFHRYFLYFALVVLAVLWWDTISAFWYRGGIYIGFGSLLMLTNVVLLTLYTFSCHALRHLVGGSLDCYSCVRFGRTRHGIGSWLADLNPFHGSFAWASLITVMAVDVYIRLINAGMLGSGLGCFGAHAGC